jgi:hypothetical protein
MPQQMSALCKHPGPQPFPNIDGEFIDRRESRDQGNTRPGSQRSEIKLRPCALIWNRSYPLRGASSMFDYSICFRSSTADCAGRTAGEFVSGQKTFRKRIRHKRTRSGLQAQIAFRVKP